MLESAEVTTTNVMRMLREKIRAWLGITEIEHRIDALNKELISVAESLNELRDFVSSEIKRLDEEKVPVPSLKEVSKRIEALQTRFDELLQLTASATSVKEYSTDREIEEAVLELLGTGREYTVTELRQILGISTRKLYKVLSGLEKSKKVKKRREGRRVYYYPTTR